MFDINTLPKSFLGANAAGGFCSKFGDSYYPAFKWHAYIIKGGPGTGKSSFMKQIAAIFAEGGSNVELCPCSSDPDSLDAVIIHDKKVVLMDGTSPHALDPGYPGACECIINLSECWNDDAFSGKEEKIIETTDKNKQLHKRASKYITAAGSLLSDNRRASAKCVNFEKLFSYTERLGDRLIKKRDRALEHHRFLSGITPKGFVFYKQTISKTADTVIAVCDEYGAVSATFMEIIRQRALEYKNEIFVYHNPIHPEIIDHVIIPNQKLCFCSINRFCHCDGITRRIHARRFTDSVSLASHKNHIQFNFKASDELLREAVAVINEAKHTHDELEQYYIEAMDFEKVGKKLEAITEKIKRRVL